MSMKEFIDAMVLFPPIFKDIGILAIILSLVQISPIKLNPWTWLKSFAELPKRLDEQSEQIKRLEHEFYDDRAFRWRQMIVNRGDRVQDGHKLRREVWNDTIETIDNYEKYCDKHPEFRNELATITIEYMRHKYQEALETKDFLA